VVRDWSVLLNTGHLDLRLAAAGITLWATFIPCFLWVFAGAPWLDRISANPRLRGALSAITAAVVGVMLNLSLWFALHVFFADVSRSSLGAVGAWLPDLATWRPWSVLLSQTAGVLLQPISLAIRPHNWHGQRLHPTARLGYTQTRSPCAHESARFAACHHRA